MHLDPVAARRTRAGAQVVHGMHVALWALDVLYARGRIRQAVMTARVEFVTFIYLDTAASVSITRENEKSMRVEVSTEGVAAAILHLSFLSSNILGASANGFMGVEIPAAPRVHDFDDLLGFSGSLQARNALPVAAMFPDAARGLDEVRIATLATLSALVGMVVPGLHSIFGGFNVRFEPFRSLNTGDLDLTFRVVAIDERFRAVTITVNGAGIAGTVNAFARPAPVRQASISTIKAHVGEKEFVGTTALIVGGSRGLGALTAKIIAAGGGRVIICYAVGEADAHDVATELDPYSATVIRYDVCEPADAQLRTVEWEINALFYFATRAIFGRHAATYSAERFYQFCRIYVDGFAAVCSSILARGVKFRAFYPSSAALDERPMHMTEYAMAKAAGEVLCADLSRQFRNLDITVKRLPRLLTDQTATLLKTEFTDSLDIMLPIIRDFYGI